MKKSIPFIILAISFTSFAQAQISKNFATELKALIDTDVEVIKGEMTSEEKTAAYTYRTYQCKLPLTGFDAQIASTGVPIISANYKGKITSTTMDDIAAKLAFFKKDHVILDSKTNKKLLEANADPDKRKILLVDSAENVKVKIILEKIKNENAITVGVNKMYGKLANELLKNTGPVQIGANFATELKALLDAEVGKIKGVIYSEGMGKTYLSRLPLSGFDVKLQEMLGDYIVKCKPDGVFSEATMDAISARLVELKKYYNVIDSKEVGMTFAPGTLARRIMVLDQGRNIKIDIQATEGYKKSDLTVYKYDKPSSKK